MHCFFLSLSHYTVSKSEAKGEDTQNTGTPEGGAGQLAVPCNQHLHQPKESAYLTLYKDRFSYVIMAIFLFYFFVAFASRLTITVISFKMNLYGPFFVAI